MSAVSRANSVEIWPRVRNAAEEIAPPSQRTRIMKYFASSRSMFSSPVNVPSYPCSRWVYRPHHRKRPRRSFFSMLSNPALA